MCLSHLRAVAIPFFDSLLCCTFPRHLCFKSSLDPKRADEIPRYGKERAEMKIFFGFAKEQ